MWARVYSLVLLGVFSFSFLALVVPHKALAAGEKYEWVDKITINVSGGRYQSGFQLKKLSSDFTIAGSGIAYDTSGCQLSVSLTVGSDPGKGTVEVSAPLAGAIGGNACSSDILSQYDKNVSIANPANATKAPVVTGPTEVDSKKITVVSVVPSDQNFPASKDTITLHKGQQSGKIVDRKTTSTDFTSGTQKGFTVGFDNLTAGDTYTACSSVLNKCTTFVKQPSSASDRVTISGQGITKEQAARTCESQGGSLAWMLCPVLVLLDNGIDFLSNSVESLLLVDASKYNDPSIVQTWRVMRNVALLLLVPMMLLMVIGTALEFGPFDAYTVRKALPRMLFAVVFITLSLYITQFLVNVSNVVGTGVQGIVLSATDSPKSLADTYSAAGGALFSTIAAGGAIGGGAYVVLSAGAGSGIGALLGLLGSLALVTFVALLIAYLVLVIRELLIIVLIIAAPLAILVWIFPDNDKMWKIWKSTFTALLMMFPLIMLLIASGKLFANIIGDTENSFTAFFLKIIAYVGPFFFIPATFKYGLGAFSSLAGAINDRGRGIFDRQRKRRAEIRQRLHENNMTGRSWLGSGKTGSTYRRVATGSFGPTKRARGKFQANELAIRARAAEEAIKMDNGRAFADDNATAAALYATSANDFIRRYIDNGGGDETDARRALSALEIGSGSRVGSGTMRAAAFRARAASSKGYAAGAEGIQELYQDAAALEKAGILARGDAAQAIKSNKARADQSGAGYGEVFAGLAKANAGTFSQTDANLLLRQALDGSRAGDIVAGHTDAVKALAPVMLERLEEAFNSGNNIEINRQLAEIAGRYDAMAQISPNSARVMAKQVLSMPAGATGTTVQDAIEKARSNPDFVTMRREYGSAERAAAAQAAAQPAPEQPGGPPGAI